LLTTSSFAEQQLLSRPTKSGTSCITFAIFQARLQISRNPLFFLARMCRTLSKLISRSFFLSLISFLILCTLVILLFSITVT
jgi:hypothetical protein